MFQEALAKVIRDFPAVNFKKSDEFLWSPSDSTVYYGNRKNDEASVWSLLHELGHAKLGHSHFVSDYELLRLEIDAWEEAKIIAKKYSLKISKDHIENCLDTYRDWIYLRSKCPTCDVHALQVDSKHYKCHNCLSTWKVSSSRFCRVHRRAVIA